MQNLYAPFWRFFGMGCKAGSQECMASLQAAGFNTDPIVTYRHPDLLVTHSLTEFGAVIKEDGRDESRPTMTSSQVTISQNPEVAVRMEGIAMSGSECLASVAA